MSDKKAAVVIPVWNRADIISKTLDSLAAQERKPDRVVVVDDGSTDGSARVVRKWAAAHAEIAIELIEQINHGAGHARNAGLRRVADSDCVLFLDSDDMIPAGFLAAALAAMYAEGEEAAVVAVAEQRAEAGFEWSTGYVEPKYNSEALCAQPIESQLYQGSGFLSAALLRTDAVLKVGGFDERVYTGQDSVFFFALASLGEWRLVPGVRATMGRSTPRLSSRCFDSRRRWAHLFDSLMEKECARRKRRLGPHEATWLSLRWMAAAHQLMGDRPLDAGHCLLRAIRTKPTPMPQLKQMAQVLAHLVRKIWRGLGGRSGRGGGRTNRGTK